MENYTKGKNIEEEYVREKIPIPNLPESFHWMKVSAGSKVNDLVSNAQNAFKDERSIVWSGSGKALQKAVTCVEIMKRNINDIHQITRLCYRKVEEHWDPQLDGLEPIVVKRDIPTIHVLLSKDPLDKSDPGYQTSHSQQKPPDKPKRHEQKRKNPRRAEMLEQFTRKEKKL